MNKNLENLLNLIKENPELKIIPMVSEEIATGSEYAYWLGSWGESRLDKCLETEREIFFYSEDEIEAAVAETFGYEEFEKMTKEEVKEKYEKLPWTDVIVTYIECSEV